MDRPEELDARGPRLRAALAAVAGGPQPAGGGARARKCSTAIRLEAHHRRVRLSDFEGQEDVTKEIEGTRLTR